MEKQSDDETRRNEGDKTKKTLYDGNTKDERKRKLWDRLKEDPDCAELLALEEESSHRFIWFGIDEFFDLLRDGIIRWSPERDNRRERLTQLEKCRMEAKQRRSESIFTVVDVGSNVVQAGGLCLL